MHPVAILKAVFCTICSLSVFVLDALGDHMVEAYLSMGLVMALYVVSGSWKKCARRDPCKTTRPIHLVKLFTNSSNTSNL